MQMPLLVWTATTKYIFLLRDWEPSWQNSIAIQNKLMALI
jgi:hypothetical protein